MKAELRTAIFLGVVIAAAMVGISIIFSTLQPATFNDVQQTTLTDNSTLHVTKIDKSKFKKAPVLQGIAHFINTTPEDLEKEMKGKVVLYDIWTYSCINCIRTLPYITAWDNKYSDDGLLIIGIHSPEFEFEKNVENVEMAVAKHGIKYPVVLDNDWETWEAFDNRYWPRKYVADNEGYIRYDHIGEGSYEETEKVIQKLLNERAEFLGLNVASAEPLVEIDEFTHTNFRTPELYFGYKFAQGRNQLGSSQGFSPGNEITYTIPESLQLHFFYLDGTWKNLEGSMKLVSDIGKIKIHYHAKEVNIVTANEANLEIFLDGKPITAEYAGKDIKDRNTLLTSDPGLYNIIASKEPSSHELEIQVNQRGFEIYTFTFG